MIPANYYRILRLAFPIILANASVPLLGLADTATIGQTGTATDLGAIALASLIFSFVYWGFGFLRMGTTGFIAQAAGAKDTTEMHALLFRAIFLALIIALLLLVLQNFIAQAALYLLSGSADLMRLVQDYFFIRIWGAPATLITFAILGALIGLGRTKELLLIQLFLNGLNIILNISFVVGLEMGVKGIAWGTVIAEWLSLILAFYILMRRLELKNPLQRMKDLKIQILDRQKMLRLFRLNTDIMLRTLALLGGFAWFANAGAKFGDTVLAANHVLLQFVSLSAFFLDGYAHVVEMLSGQAYGARLKSVFLLELRQSTILAGFTAVFLAFIVYSFSPYLIPLLSRDMQVQDIAQDHVIYAALYILLSFMAFQLDGVFIGVTKSREMRNATIMSLIIFIAAATWLSAAYANTGLWMAFILFVVARAFTLGYYYPRITKQLST